MQNVESQQDFLKRLINACVREEDFDANVFLLLHFMYVYISY
jgi:hypothetical protein